MNTNTQVVDSADGNADLVDVVMAFDAHKVSEGDLMEKEGYEPVYTPIYAILPSPKVLEKICGAFVPEEDEGVAERIGRNLAKAFRSDKIQERAWAMVLLASVLNPNKPGWAAGFSAVHNTELPEELAEVQQLARRLAHISK